MAQYVNNKELLSALLEYHKIKQEAESQGLEVPNPSDFICTCIMKIAEHYSFKPNFINYSYRDDMVLDAVEGCLNAAKKHFNPEKSSNPFGYFTQICHYAFLHRIKKEKRQTTIKNKIILQVPVEMFELQDHDDEGDYVNTHIQFLQDILRDSDVVEFNKKPEKTPVKTIENFFED